jgi:hypothetical protein
LNHFLDRDGDAHFKVVETLLLPVENSSGFKEGGPALLNSGYYLFITLHIKEGTLLTSK